MKEIYFRLITIRINVRDFLGLFLPVRKNKQAGLRILIFNWRDTKHLWAGGAEIYIHELAKRWVENGNSVTIFCGNDQLNHRNEVIDGVTIIRRGGFYTVYAWAILYFIFKFRNNFDVVIDSENGIPFFIPLFTIKPVVLLIHHVHQDIFIEQMKFPLSHIGKFIEGKLMPFVYRNKAVITVSESSKMEIVRSGIAREDQIFIVNPGTAVPLVLHKKTSYPTIAYVGRLKAYKNIDVAIKAFKIINQKIPSSKFWIVGDGDMHSSLMKLVEHMNLQKSVIFLGHVTEGEKNKILSKSWIAIQPSQVEGWGLTVLEANACKTPVIASRTKGLCDSILDGKTGMLATTGNVSEFANHAILLLKNNKKREDLAVQAYAWAKKFDWSRSADAFYEVLALAAVKNPAISFRKAFYLVNRLSTFLA